MNQTKTSQLKLCESAAKAGRLQDLCWLGTNLSRGHTMGIPGEPPIVPVVPIVEQEDLYKPADWREWFDLSRLLAEIMCKEGSRHNHPIEFVPAVAEYTKLAEKGWKTEVWRVFDQICPNCGRILSNKPILDTNKGILKQICRICLSDWEI